MNFLYSDPLITPTPTTTPLIRVLQTNLFKFKLVSLFNPQSENIPVAIAASQVAALIVPVRERTTALFRVVQLQINIHKPTEF